jgi:MOSC domain-containing protein YiiM
VGGVVRSVNVGPVGQLTWGGKTHVTAFVKSPVGGRVAVGRLGLDGDERAYADAVDDPDNAVYAYAVEDYAWWAEQEGRPFPPATLAENLTTEGVDTSGAVIGERWLVGSVLLEVCKPRIGCSKMAARMADRGFVKRFDAANRPGAYLRVVEEGELGAGDGIVVVDRPDHGVTIAEVYRAVLGEHDLAPRLLAAPQLAAGMRRWAERRVAES